MDCIWDLAERVAGATHADSMRIDIFLSEGNPGGCTVNENSLSSGMVRTPAAQHLHRHPLTIDTREDDSIPGCRRSHLPTGPAAERRNKRGGLSACPVSLRRRADLPRTRAVDGTHLGGAARDGELQAAGG
eukprot:scaffold1768_cov194-Prasinococcus_capsulatus_cf.AAC.5